MEPLSRWDDAIRISPITVDKDVFLSSELDQMLFTAEPDITSSELVHALETVTRQKIEKIIAYRRKGDTVFGLVKNESGDIIRFDIRKR